MILMHPTEREKGINLRFSNVVSGDTIVAGLGARVSYTAAIGGNPDIEPKGPRSGRHPAIGAAATAFVTTAWRFHERIR